MCDLRRVLLEALWSLIPVSAHTLRGQLNFLVALVYDLAKAEICYFYLAVVENDVLRLEVKVNNFLFTFIQVFESAKDL